MRALVTAAVAPAGAAAVLLAGCTGASDAGPSAPVTQRSTVTETRSPTTPVSTFTPAPATSVAPLPPGRSPRAGEVEKLCPYIRSGVTQTSGGADTLAENEGDHVYRTTVLTRYSPIGCRFYFYSGEHQAIADILPQRFATATDAHNALVLTARQGGENIGYPDFVPGVDGISYRTRFLGADGAQDWAFAFAKGRVLVVVHTQQTNVSANARNIAQVIVGKF